MEDLRFQRFLRELFEFNAVDYSAALGAFAAGGEKAVVMQIGTDTCCFY